LVVGGSGGSVRLLDAIDGERKGEFDGHVGGVAALVCMADGRIVAVGALGGKINLWDPAAPDDPKTIDPAGVVRTSAVSVDGKRLAYATTEHVVRVVEIESGVVLGEYRGHADQISTLLFAPDGNTIASASEDRTVKIWDVPGRKLTVDLTGDDLKTLVVEFSAGGETAAIAGYDGTIRICDVASGTERRRLTGHTGNIRALSLLYERLLSCSEDATLRLWNTKEGKEIERWDHPTWVLDAVGTDKKIVTIDGDGAIRIATSGNAALEDVADPFPGKIELAAFSPVGRRVLVAHDTTVDLYDLVNKQLHLGVVQMEKKVTAIKFAGDTWHFAVGDDGGTVVLGDALDLGRHQVLRGHSRGVYSLAFSPDDRVLASASGGRWLQLAGEVKLWDVASGQVHATLDGATAPIAFSSGGRRLAVSEDAERRIRVWTAAPYRAAPWVGH
jgi:WD40 repeat protein